MIINESNKIFEYSDDFIPYNVIRNIFEDNYRCVVTTNEYNWVQQNKLNVSSEDPISVNKINYLINNARYTTQLRELSHSGKKYKFARR